MTFGEAPSGAPTFRGRIFVEKGVFEPDFYASVFSDWPEVTCELNFQEKGRLTDAIVMYERGDGGWKDRLKGNERFVFPAYKGRLDRARAAREAKETMDRVNGRKGGRPKKNPPVYSETQGFQNNPPVFSETQGFSKNPRVFQETQGFQRKPPVICAARNNNNYNYKPQNVTPGNPEEEEDEYKYHTTQSLADVIAAAWRESFGTMPNPATVRAVERWAGFCRFGREDFVREAISMAASRNANDPAGYIIALFKDWRRRGVEEVDELE